MAFLCVYSLSFLQNHPTYSPPTKGCLGPLHSNLGNIYVENMAEAVLCDVRGEVINSTWLSQTL